ncbi:hypothetical protein evm_006110 [Chilo suppressalis]|nr:hypothetical protein evm_006110 [Chilo suppressalis]
MISGQCMKVGDVVRALNGLSIQIENTDMEGRLMMADALVYGQALHKPALVVDVATLTNAKIAGAAVINTNHPHLADLHKCFFTSVLKDQIVERCGNLKKQESANNTGLKNTMLLLNPPTSRLATSVQLSESDFESTNIRKFAMLPAAKRVRYKRPRADCDTVLQLAIIITFKIDIPIQLT